MIVAGRVSQKMAPVVKRLYEQMPYPKWVIAMGACASSGGMFSNYAIIQGVDKSYPWMSTCGMSATPRGVALGTDAPAKEDRNREVQRLRLIGGRAHRQIRG